MSVLHRIAFGTVALSATAAIALAGAGPAAAATPAPATSSTATSSTVGVGLFNNSHETLLYTHVTGRVPAPNQESLEPGQHQDFELPDARPWGHSSGNVYYDIYQDNTLVGLLNVHIDAVEVMDNTATITDPNTGVPVKNMTVTFDGDDGQYHNDMAFFVTDC